ncbi:MAG: NUDIX domain-containing protein [Betaproteobacteria bacterium]
MASPTGLFAGASLCVLENTLASHRHPKLLFCDDLQSADWNQLRALLAQARHSPSPHTLPWWCGAHAMGHVAHAHVAPLLQALQPCQASATQLVWSPDMASTAERSQALESALQMLYSQGHLGGWRGERFSYWSHDTVLPLPLQSDFVRVERAGFLYLGMLSHAVHINGFTPDGHLWCGQRSATKATDPGLWDNLTAGGLPAGETLLQCAGRELWEEAGVTLENPAALQAADHVRISQMAPGGWHDEVLHVFNIALADNFIPCNQDGEVQAFAKLSAPEVMQRIAAGQFTPDAALAIAQGLLAAD